MHHYKDHTVILASRRDKGTGQFIPVASITWETDDGKCAQHSLTSSERCVISLYAVDVAFDEAKLWIDRRLSHS